MGRGWGGGFEPPQCLIRQRLHGQHHSFLQILGNGLCFFVAVFVEAVYEGDFAVGGQALAAEQGVAGGVVLLAGAAGFEELLQVEAQVAAPAPLFVVEQEHGAAGQQQDVLGPLGLVHQE